MAVKIIYSDVALGAAEDAAVSVTDRETFADPGLLPVGVPSAAVVTLEHNAWLLSGEYEPKAGQQFALWSSARSGNDGTFATPPTITVTFSQQYTSSGLTLRFAGDGDYCSKISVQWLQGGAVKDSGTFYPTESLFLLERAVQAYDKVVIRLEETNLPRRRAKLEQLLFGIVREFDGEELTGARFVHEVSLISDTVPINVMDASFHGKTGAEYIFQRKQPVEAYNDGDLIGVYYIEKGERTGTNDYAIACQDAIGTLDLDTYPGALYLTDTPVEDVLADIVGGAFELNIDPAFAGATVRGLIPEAGTRRQALQAVAFTIGACVDTSGTRKIKVFPAPTGSAAVIPAADTYVGGKVNTSDTITEVVVTAYDITSSTPGSDDDAVKFAGREYKTTLTSATATNPNTVTTDLANRVVVEGCYLVNSGNAQAVADRLLAYYMRRQTYSTKHVVHGQAVGDRAEMTLPWSDQVTGHITKMTVSITGLVVADTELLID